MTKQRRADMFMNLDADPREGSTTLGDERATLIEFLRCQRLTLQIKCEGLYATQLDCRAVEPSTMSLLGLVRHMAEVERAWFRQRFAGQDLPKPTCPFPPRTTALGTPSTIRRGVTGRPRAVSGPRVPLVPTLDRSSHISAIERCAMSGRSGCSPVDLSGRSDVRGVGESPNR